MLFEGSMPKNKLHTKIKTIKPSIYQEREMKSDVIEKEA